MPSSKRATTRTSGCSNDTAARWRGVASVAAVVLGAAGLAAAGQALQEAAPRPDAVADFMRAKLAHCQDVLEGLTTKNFDLIDKGAQELSLVSQDASWQVLQTEDYARHSADFRRSCDSLRKAAKDKNLDGAALAWMEVTMKCIQCHSYVRDEQERTAP